jgi:hypothetical protein
MFPATWNVRSTVGSPPVGDVMLKNSCGGGMVQSYRRKAPLAARQFVSDAKSVDTA